MNYCEKCGEHSDELIEVQDNESIEMMEICKHCFTIGNSTNRPKYIQTGFNNF